MNIINQAMMYLLNLLHTLVGNYGLAIVLITVLIRVVLWPLNSAQTRSMRKMQELQPKLKVLQERYKDNPQKMQEAMMKFYAEHKFNPMAGCLPMLVQLPIFIGLYGALSSPHFLVDTVNEHFLFLKNLSHTLHSHAGQSLDGTFAVDKNDTFSADKTVRLTMNSGKVQEQEASNPQHLISVFPKPMMPGSPVTMTLDFKNLGLSDDYKQLVKAADVLVVNNQSRELERVHFDNVNGALSQQINTAKGKDGINTDVLILILIYGALTLLYQRVMTPKNQAAASKDDPAAAAMQSPAMKLMPLMFVVMMFFIPIPSGALIYLVVTTALMLIQTLWINYSEGKKEAAKPGRPSEQIVDIKVESR